MRIGIDLDDTICRTTESVHNYLDNYSKDNNLNPLDIMNDEDLKLNFFKQTIKDIYTNAEIKREVSKVLKRLKNKGNEIYIITARSNYYFLKENQVEQITENWLKENNIEYDKVIYDVYGEKRASICKKYKIDLMIDDDPYNYKKIVAKGLKCLLYDDREKYNLEKDYVTNWLQIEKYIERNR